MGKKPSERSIDELLKYGIAIIDKPEGPSSHEVSAFARKILNIPITGHTGTLDQNVSGVLVVLLNESRKTVSFIPSADKTYVCLMKTHKAIGRDALLKTLSNFKGEIYQTPPAQSAVAKRLRVRKVHELELLEVEGNLALFMAKCEAGTYIRKIVSDCGELLGMRTEMIELRRTQAGNFTEKDAVTLQQLSDYYWAWKEKEDEGYLRKAIRPVESLEMKKISISDDAAKKIRHGIRPKISDALGIDENIHRNERIGLFTGKGELIAMGESNFESSDLKSALKKNPDEPMARISRVIHAF